MVAFLVNCEVIVYHEDKIRLLTGLLQLGVPDERGLLEVESGQGL